MHQMFWKSETLVLPRWAWHRAGESCCSCSRHSHWLALIYELTIPYSLMLKVAPRSSQERDLVLSLPGFLEKTWQESRKGLVWVTSGWWGVSPYWLRMVTGGLLPCPGPRPVLAAKYLAHRYAIFSLTMSADFTSKSPNTDQEKT